MKTTYKTLIITILIILIAGCQSATKNYSIEYDIETVDIYGSILPEIDSHESNYYFSDVYNDTMIAIKQDYLRHEFSIYGINTPDAYLYDLIENTASKIDVEVSDEELLLSMIMVKDDLYFYIISCKNEDSYETLYYLDQGDRSNTIYHSKNESIFEPPVVVDGDDIYFVVGDTKEKDLKISRGYDQYLNLRIYKLNNELAIDTIYEATEDLYAFFFDDSDPISFLTVKKDNKMIFNTYEDGTIREYLCHDEYDGIAAFGGSVYGIHDNWGEEDRELYWYDLKNEIKIPMERRAEAHQSLGDYEIVIDNTGTTIMKNVNGDIIMREIEEGLENALYAIKIDDDSAFVRCRDDVLKRIDIRIESVDQ